MVRARVTAAAAAGGSVSLLQATDVGADHSSSSSSSSERPTPTQRTLTREQFIALYGTEATRALGTMQGSNSGAARRKLMSSSGSSGNGGVVTVTSQFADIINPTTDIAIAQAATDLHSVAPANITGELQSVDVAVTERAGFTRVASVYTTLGLAELDPVTSIYTITNTTVIEADGTYYYTATIRNTTMYVVVYAVADPDMLCDGGASPDSCGLCAEWTVGSTVSCGYTIVVSSAPQLLLHVAATVVVTAAAALALAMSMPTWTR